MITQDIKTEDYLYDLPLSRIADFPLEKRDQSKLLLYHKGGLPQQDSFSNLATHLDKDSLLILNDTRVIHARLLFQKTSGAAIEVFCLSPILPVRELQSAFGQTSPVVWECLVGNLRRWKNVKLILRKNLAHRTVTLTAELVNASLFSAIQLNVGTNQAVRFSWDVPEMNFSTVIELFGHVPLPPYIHREAVESDKTRYQTLYACQEGSVAAPTAGFHFTPEVFSSLQLKGISTTFLTLHVGAGTFRPLTADKIGDHTMHAEPFEITQDLLDTLLTSLDKQFIAVGTTTVRTLESLYWAGLRLLRGKLSLDHLMIEQWEPYQLTGDTVYSKKEVLTALKQYFDYFRLSSLKGHTRLIIAPGYRFRMLEGIITNFHQPGSTLLLLIAAYLGEDWRKVYTWALEKDFRFLSYGDSCLFLP